MEFKFSSDELNVSKGYRTNEFEVVASIDEDDVFSNLTMNQCVDFYGKTDLIDFIGEEFIREYLGLDDE